MLYSAAFRRLAGTTQVAPSTAEALHHNRLTHTLEVAQIARRTAEHLLRRYPDRLSPDETLSPDVVEAAALVHDLGHPPFGHHGERVLCELVDAVDPEAGGFEANAQSFRIVTRLAVRSADGPGLDLTRATLRATLKYPWPRGAHPDATDKYGVYPQDAEAFEWAVGSQAPPRRTLEAEVVDFADDVAYSVHDVYDFARARTLPLETLLTGDGRAPFLDRVAAFLQGRPALAWITRGDLDRAVDWLASVYPLGGPFSGSSADRAALHRFSSRLIERFAVQGSSLTASDPPTLAVEPEVRVLVEVLKQAVWQVVVEAPELERLRVGQREVVRALFARTLEALEHGAVTPLAPVWAREAVEEGQPLARVSADVVASLTEAQANGLAEPGEGAD